MTTESTSASRPAQAPSALAVWTLLLAIFAAVHLASLFSPPLLDDVDASHAQAAQHMLQSGDWTTLKVDGIRYLEKPPLPYWIDAGLYRIFGENVFATHLPNALALLGCAWLGWLWAGRAWGPRAGFYAALGILTSIGPFLFTRFAIPEALLSFLFLLALYCFLTGIESRRPARFYVMWAALALATLTKGLIAPVFFVGAAIPLLLLSGQWRRWREFKPLTGLLLFLAIAAPWHILAGLANPDQGHPVGNHPTPGNVHGFWYFYFVNEHVLRFLGERFPHDYNKLPFVAYWLLHLVWLFPWSLFLPAVARRRLEDPPQLAAAPAPRRRPDRRLLSRLRRARRRGQLRLRASSSASAPSGCSRSSPPSRCCSSPSRPIRSTTPSRPGRRC